MGEGSGRSSSGVRGEGDDYQHLVTLNEALRAMRGNGITSLTVEASQVGNVDDIVLRDAHGTGRFTQIKHAVDAQTPIGETYLLKPNRSGRMSLLQRFHRSWNLLGGAAAGPDMRLVTDRDLDPQDPVMRMLDRRSGLLVPAIAGSALREQRAAWADHIGASEDELVALLSNLRIETGRSMTSERETAALQLEALGLASSQGALDSGLALVREWVQERERTLSVEEVTELVTQRVGRRTDPAALLVVEGVDDHVAAAQADEHLRFVERYDGATGFERYQLATPEEWETIVWPTLQAAGGRLKSSGRLNVHVAGAMRLPMWFGVGCALRDVLGFTVSTIQRGESWTSKRASAVPALQVQNLPWCDDVRVAVILSIAADATRQAVAHAEKLGLGRGVVISPEGGASNTSVPDGPAAAALAEMIRNIVRDLGASEIHLFMAVPAGLALLLGHRWNRTGPTVVYEHTPGGYVRTFRVAA